MGASERQVEQLLEFVGLLAKWNRTYNLTAIRDPSEMLSHHVIDCLAVIQPLRRECGGRASTRLLDVGSGGGLPGLVIAVLEPDVLVTCVDAVGKKAAFVQQAALSLGLPNLRAEHARIESLQAEPFQFITSRAFASLRDFVMGSARLLAPDGVWMAMKGKRPDDEIAALPDGIDVFHVEQTRSPGFIGDRCLVWMRPRNSPSEHTLC